MMTIVLGSLEVSPGTDWRHLRCPRHRAQGKQFGRESRYLGATFEGSSQDFQTTSQEVAVGVTRMTFPSRRACAPVIWLN